MHRHDRHPVFVSLAYRLLVTLLPWLALLAWFSRSCQACASRDLAPGKEET